MEKISFRLTSYPISLLFPIFPCNDSSVDCIQYCCSIMLYVEDRFLDILILELTIINIIRSQPTFDIFLRIHFLVHSYERLKVFNYLGDYLFCVIILVDFQSISFIDEFIYKETIFHV